MKMNITLKPGDIFLTRGQGFISKAIRFFTRSFGEKRTKVNHVGVIVQEGNFETCIGVEAKSSVFKHKLWDVYGPRSKDLVAIYRPLKLDNNEIKTVVAEAEEQVGKKYNWPQIVAHFLDWLFLGVYFFRRLVPNGKYAICSWLVAHAYSKVGEYFQAPTGAVQPDDIWDYVNKYPNKYKRIYPLKSIWDID